MEDLQSPAVKYEALIHCVNSRRDTNGNVYWLAYFENPNDIDRPRVCVEVAGPGNARLLASKAIYGEKKMAHGTFANGNARCYTTEEEIPIRPWFRRRKWSLYEGAEETLEALRKLLAPAAEQQLSHVILKDGELIARGTPEALSDVYLADNAAGAHVYRVLSAAEYAAL